MLARSPYSTPQLTTPAARPTWLTATAVAASDTQLAALLLLLLLLLGSPAPKGWVCVWGGCACVCACVLGRCVRICVA